MQDIHLRKSPSSVIEHINILCGQEKDFRLRSRPLRTVRERNITGVSSCPVLGYY